jgi:hypothetical protein
MKAEFQLWVHDSEWNNWVPKIWVFGICYSLATWQIIVEALWPSQDLLGLAGRHQITDILHRL